MITRSDFVCVRDAASSAVLCGPTVREFATRWISAYEPQPGAWQLTIHPSCQCCGSFRLVAVAGSQFRCPKHADRNPCLVEGCKRTRAAGSAGLATDQVVCGEHWRRYVPPHSPERRAYNRFWRLAKRQGWTPELIRRFERFWNALAARIRRRAAEGFVDQRAIEELFGWSEAA